MTIGLVAKYVDNSDTYLSVTEALKSAAWGQKSEVNDRWINAETATEADFAGVDGILVPADLARAALRAKLPPLSIV